ncbi:hypothetical protein Hanom_Chr09g00810691 [Helianthus anomalus]
MSIQLQHDKGMRTLKCIVNKASYPAVENIEATSSSATDATKTPAPTTPGQKGSIATGAKRQLEFDGKPSQPKYLHIHTPRILTLNKLSLADSDPTLERLGKRSLTN